MAKMKIRKGTMGDVEAIAGHCVRFADETENRALESQVVTRGVKAVVKDPHKGFYLVAETGGELVGQLLVTKEWSDWSNQYYWWVTGAYVHEEARRQGVFSTLYRFLREMALSDRGVAGLRLTVPAIDETAKEIYESFGLVRSAYDLYEDDLSWVE